MRHNRVWQGLAGALILVALAPGAAQAYIDPGTGSFVLQGIIAAVLGAGVTLRIFWNRLRGRKTDPHDDDAERHDHL